MEEWKDGWDAGWASKVRGAGVFLKGVVLLAYLHRYARLAAR